MAVLVALERVTASSAAGGRYRDRPARLARRDGQHDTICRVIAAFGIRRRRREDWRPGAPHHTGDRRGEAIAALLAGGVSAVLATNLCQRRSKIRDLCLRQLLRNAGSRPVRSIPDDRCVRNSHRRRPCPGTVAVAIGSQASGCHAEATSPVFNFANCLLA